MKHDVSKCTKIEILKIINCQCQRPLKEKLPEIWCASKECGSDAGPELSTFIKPCLEILKYVHCITLC